MACACVSYFRSEDGVLQRVLKADEVAGILKVINEEEATSGDA